MITREGWMLSVRIYLLRMVSKALRDRKYWFVVFEVRETTLGKRLYVGVLPRSRKEK